MTLAKLICCQVDHTHQNNQRMAFSRAQMAWERTADCIGFGGQLGGWAEEDCKAYIFALWDNQPHVAHFMATRHNDIIVNNNQNATYRSCSVNYFKLDHHLSSSNATSLSGEDIVNIKLMRIADCRGITDIARFRHDQQVIWNPALSACDGMLRLCVWRSLNDAHHMLVVSFWASFQAHQDYCSEVYPTLNAEAKPNSYIKQLTGTTVPIERLWDIIPKHKTLELD